MSSYEQAIVPAGTSRIFGDSLSSILGKLCPGPPPQLRKFGAAVCSIGSRQLKKMGRLHPRHWRMVKKFEDHCLYTMLPVITVGLIMGTMTFSFTWICLPALGWTFHGVTSLVFHSSMAIAVVSYHEGMVTDPGRIPEDWRKEPGGATKERKKSGSYRFCTKERIYKPDRAHYCSALARNVLRMDHYCPWMSTCVGFKNHKYFILCVFYTVIAADVANGCTFRALLALKLSVPQVFMLSIGSVISSLLAATLMPFFGFHCWLLSMNMTTLEFCEKYGSRDWRNRYDRGVWNNIKCVMGDRWQLWLLPVGEPPGDGVDWPEVEPVLAAPAAAAAVAVAVATVEEAPAEAPAPANCTSVRGRLGSLASSLGGHVPLKGAWAGMREIHEDIMRALPFKR